MDSTGRTLAGSLVGFLLVLFLVAACSADVTAPGEDGPEASHRLTLTAPTESFGEILENGSYPSDVSRYSIRYFPKSGFDRYVKGSSQDKVVTEATAPVAGKVLCVSPGTESCGRLPFFDGFQVQEIETPDIWDGSWTAELSVRQLDDTSKKCTVDFGFNHIDNDPKNGSFFDIHAGDQKIRFNVSSSGSCTGQFVLDAGYFRQPIPPSPLRAKFPAGTPAPPQAIRGYVGDAFVLQAVPSGGFGSYRYAWKVVAKADPVQFGGLTADFSGVEFGTSSTKTVTFMQPGTYWARYLLRDGDDVEGHGGNYALSPLCIIEVASRPQLGAQAVSHTLPGTATQYTWYATSVTLKNIGTQTWSGSSFSLGQMPSQYWSPTSATFGSGTVATNQTKSFNYNTGMMGSWVGWQNNYWKIRNSGVAFGDSIGRRSYVKVGSEPPPVASEGWNWHDLLARLGPPAVQAVAPLVTSVQGDVVQTAEVRDFPLPKEEIAATGEFRIRYAASLAEPWDVDFIFEVEYDPTVFDLGKLKKGARGESHAIQVDLVAPGLLIVVGKRIGRPGLEGDGLIFEVPLVLKSGATIPDTFPRVTLTAVQ